MFRILRFYTVYGYNIIHIGCIMILTILIRYYKIIDRSWRHGDDKLIIINTRLVVNK